MVTTPASADRLDPAQRLRHARHELVTRLDDPQAGEPRAVNSTTPIRPLPDEVGAVVVARAQAGLTPAGPDFPRRPLLKRVAVPSAALAVLDIVLLVIALVSGNGTLAVIAAVLLVVFGAAAVGAARYAAADPLRIGPREQRAIDGSGRWTPSSARNSAGPQRTLVASASDAAQRIVDSPAWREGLLVRGGVVLSLAAELDLVETQAATTDDEDWARLVTRVAALLAYADTVETLDVTPTTDTPDAADTEVLAFFLSGAIYDVS